jgi:hypothetical protein
MALSAEMIKAFARHEHCVIDAFMIKKTCRKTGFLMYDI